MQFLTNDDLLTQIKQVDLDVVTEGVQSHLDSAELKAIEEMTDYLNVKYDPAAIFSATALERNQSVILRCVDITLYHAHARIMPDNVPELRDKRYNQAVGWLEKVADGFIAPMLPLKSEEPQNPHRYGSSSEKQDQYF